MQSGSVHVCYGVGYTAFVDRMLEVIAGVTVGKCFGAAGSLASKRFKNELETVQYGTSCTVHFRLGTDAFCGRGPGIYRCKYLFFLSTGSR